MYDWDTIFLRFYQVTSTIPKYLVIQASNTGSQKQKNKLYARNHFVQIQLIMCLLFTKPENSHRQTDWPNELEYCNKTR